MINLPHLSKLKIIIIFFYNTNFQTLSMQLTPVDIWEKKENQSEQKNQISDEKEINNRKAQFYLMM